MSRHAHRLSYLVLACAIVLRVLVPAGWMPAASGGPFAIEPCPAVEAVPVMAMTVHHHEGADHGSHKAHDGDCAFAPFAGDFAASDTSPAVSILALTIVPLLEPQAASFFATGPPSLLPPATGPPAHA